MQELPRRAQLVLASAVAMRQGMLHFMFSRCICGVKHQDKNVDTFDDFLSFIFQLIKHMSCQENPHCSKHCY